MLNGIHINISFFFLDKDVCKSVAHGCEHICVNNDDSYICKCQEGYVLKEDQKTCRSKYILFRKHLFAWFLKLLDLTSNASLQKMPHFKNGIIFESPKHMWVWCKMSEQLTWCSHKQKTNKLEQLFWCCTKYNNHSFQTSGKKPKWNLIIKECAL